MLQDREGESFAAVVTDADERGARIQLRDLPVVTRLALRGAAPGDAVTVRLTAADPDRQRIMFEPA
jgi:translation initiation factor IF-1